MKGAKHHFKLAYSVSSDVKAIQAEISTNGPVEALSLIHI